MSLDMEMAFAGVPNPVKKDAPIEEDLYMKMKELES